MQPLEIRRWQQMLLLHLGLSGPVLERRWLAES